MSLFEYDQGHLIPAQFGHPVAPEAQGEILESIRRQVLEVIARPLFPVTWNDMSVMPVADLPDDPAGATQGTDAASPRLTALDGSGQVVLVEVMDHLDSASLIAALARLGAISNLGWNDLAAVYPGGVGAFRSGWTQFRDAMPPNLAAGPRLILVATEIDPKVRPALDALTASGLEVHHVSVREMSNGRRFLDVQRVAASIFSHDTNLLAGRAARMPAITSSTDADVLQEGDEPATTSLADAPLGVADLATPSLGNPGVSGASAPQPAAEVSPVPPVPAPPASPSEPTPADSEPDAATSGEPAPMAEPVDEPALQTGSISRRSIMEAAQASSVSPLAAAEDDEPVQSLFTTTQHGVVADSAPSFADIISGDSKDASTPSRHSHRATVTEPTHSVTETAQEPAAEDDADLLRRDAQGLRILAEVAGGDTPLVAIAGMDDISAEVEATLTTAGTIVFEGREFDDATVAAQSLGQDVDGWDFWHLGDEQGPTLAEAQAEINAEIIRNR